MKKNRRAWNGRGLEAIWVLLCLWASLVSPKALIFYATGDPTYNTNAPTGSLTNTGWQYEGSWYTFLGTAIAPHYFVTAKHIGGEIGESFYLNGTAYVTTAYFDHTNADLRIWCVDGTFPVYAALYPRQDETGSSAMLFGRGTQRADAINTVSKYNHPLKGWQWGAADHVQRWGQNTVAGVSQDPTSGSEILAFAFMNTGGSNHCTISTGDSGGGMFINDQGAWKLAGTIWAVEGPYALTSEDAGFYGAIFDKGGLYCWQTDGLALQAETPQRQPQYFFTTRISDYLDWFETILASESPVLLSATTANGAYTPESTAIVSAVTRTARISLTVGPRFFLLSDTTQRRIVSLVLDRGELVLTYE